MSSDVENADLVANPRFDSAGSTPLTNHHQLEQEIATEQTTPNKAGENQSIEHYSVGELILRDLMLKSDNNEVSICLNDNQCYHLGNGDDTYNRVKSLLDGLKNYDKQ